MSLGLCMIVRDEAEQLDACLKSVQGWVDEQIIVDTGSVDQTRAIARGFGAQLYEFEWCDDFAAARNFSLQWVKSDWILVLDADEVVIPDVRKPLTQQMRSPDTLLINLLREELGSKQTPFTLVSRLFRNHLGLQFKRPYHELIDDSVTARQSQESHWKIETYPTPALRHSGYQPQALAKKAKGERAQRLLEKGIQQYPDDAYLFSKLGGLQVDRRQYDKAKQTLEQGLALSPFDPSVIYELHYHLGLVYSAQGLVKQAESAYQQAIAQPHPELLKLGAYLNLGSLYLNQGVLEAALTLLRHVTKICPGFAMAHYNLGLVYKSLHQLPDAIAAYQQAIALDPNYAAAYQNLGVVLFKVGKVTDSRAAFQRAIALYEIQDPEMAERLRTGIQALGLYF